MRISLLMILAIVLIGSAASAQQVSFLDFDTHPDSVVSSFYLGAGDTSRIAITMETTNVQQGSAAIRYDYLAQRSESWGGFAKYEMWNPDSNAVWDLSAFENLTLWHYNDVPSSDPGRLHLRIQIYDVSDAPVNTYNAEQTELWYSFEYILDDTPGWNQLILPLEDVGPDAFNGSNGFYRTGWSGITGNDFLNLDKVKGIGFEISIDAPQDLSIHTGQILFDDMGFSGARPVPLVFFNGRVIPSDKSYFAWNGGLSVEEGTGETPGTNAMRWDQTPGQPWTGFVFDFDPKFMTFRWAIDSLKFKIKAPTGTSTLRVQFGDTQGNLVKTLINEPAGGYNDTWMNIAVPLRNIVDFENGTEFDTSAVTRFEMMAEGTGNGHIIRFDDMWTGNPEIDVIAPDPPSNVTIFTDALSNLVTWIDTPNENGETYNVYYSTEMITDVTAPGVEVVEQGLNVSENVGSTAHLLFYPLNDTNVDLYYAVTAVDAAGNESIAEVSTLTSNLARGIATISLNTPVNFAADGDLNDWANIPSFNLSPSLGSHIVTNTTITDDNDLSAEIRLAVDNDYLYFAFDFTDDAVDTTASNTWEKDSPDLFLGLFDWHGAPHTGYSRGSEPDYQFRFLPTRVLLDNLGSAAVPFVDRNIDYYWAEQFPTGYVIEGRLSLANIASVGGDDLFVPSNGMRIPFDLSLNDADGGGVRQGIMTWSPYNDDTSWQSPSFWLHTWIGDQTMVGIDDEPVAGVPFRYSLDQNYPNPFNPATTIRYSLAENTKVSLAVYNTLGQKVATLVNSPQAAGEYQINFDARNLASGIYFYRLEAGNFNRVQKMILMK